MSPRISKLYLAPALASNIGWSALRAFRGAQYHLEMISRLLPSPAFQTHWENDGTLDPTTKERYEAQLDAFEHHLRAFFLGTHSNI